MCYRDYIVYTNNPYIVFFVFQHFLSFGLCRGFVFAKVVYGDGGHQDNVFEEAHTFIEWVFQFGEKTALYVVLIDTDRNAKVEQLKNKILVHHGNEQKNIVVANHIEFQQFIIDKYSNISSV